MHFTSGWSVSEKQLEEVALHSEVLDQDCDFLEAEFRKKCESIISPADVEPADCAQAYMYLKRKFYHST